MTLLAKRSGRRAVVLAALTLLTVSLMASSASALTRAGSFSCTADAATVFGSPIVVANPQESPCVFDSESALNPTVLNTTIGAAHAQTGQRAGALPANGDFAVATATDAGVLTTLIPGHTIKVDAVSSTVRGGCTNTPRTQPLHFKFKTAESEVAGLNIDGTQYDVLNSPLTIAVDDVAAVSVNKTTTTSNSVTQTAVEVDLLGSPVLTLADSTVDFSGNPCGTV